MDLRATLSVRNALVLGVLFLLISFGLGYPILNRYDPGKINGSLDAAVYSKMVRNPLRIDSYRPFVPALAKPFYWIANGRIGSWDPALFGMLMATSILTAATAVTIIAIGLRCRLSYSTSLVGALLFLLNFAVPNWNLSGYVDSGEAFFLAMVTWSLLSARWYLLPIWAIPGVLSKDTFAPFVVCFALVWWLSDRPLRFNRLIWIGALTALSGAAVLLSLSQLGSRLSGSMNYMSEMGMYSQVGFVRAIVRCITAREFFYIFIWALPLGLLRLTRLDQHWVRAVAATFLLALLLGAYDDAQGNTARALFNVTGPLLCLSTAALIVELSDRTTKPTTAQSSL